MALSEAARKKKNEYQRQWRKKNAEKVKEYETRKWEKKAAEAALEDQQRQQALDDDKGEPAAIGSTGEGATI